MIVGYILVLISTTNGFAYPIQKDYPAKEYCEAAGKEAETSGFKYVCVPEYV